MINITLPDGSVKQFQEIDLIIDEEAANVVKLIYEKYLAGFGTMQIADYLSKKKIPIPSDYNKRKRGTKSLTYGLWQQSTVRFILSNEIYTGDIGCTR